MKEPRWVTDSVVRAIHERVLADYGGESGIRDQGLLESALARPRQLHHYETPDVPDLAAAYAAGIIRNRPFVDGNKRVGFMAAYVFLVCNGVTMKADEASAARAVWHLAAGQLSEAQFARWLRDNTGHER